MFEPHLQSTHTHTHRYRATCVCLNRGGVSAAETAAPQTHKVSRNNSRSETTSVKGNIYCIREVYYDVFNNMTHV